MSKQYDDPPTTGHTAERAYERIFLEMLLRHELPEDCAVKVTVVPKRVEAAEATKAEAKFTLRGDRIDVASDIGDLDLDRVILPSPPNW